MAGFLDNLPKVTRSILIVCVIVFLGQAVGELIGKGDVITEYFALFYPASGYFRFWQPLTYMFVHGGFMHLFFNMWAFIVFGAVLEKALGEKRYLTLFLVCGLGAAAVHLGVEYFQYRHYFAGFVALNPGHSMEELTTYFNAYQVDMACPPTVGASGAIYGIMLAFSMMWPNARLTLLFPPVSLKAKWLAIIFIGIELLTGIFLTSDGVAHFAHLGGMLFAFILMIWWKRRGVIRKYYW